jgi:uncharacterized membrane-anchored protein
MKLVSLVVFAIVVAAQWIVPGSMIMNKEKILLQGKIFHFRTEPVDPANPFKGKYIRLNFRENQFTSVSPDSTLQSYDDVYVILAKDKDGFAAIKDVTKRKPGTNVDFVKATVNYLSKIDNGACIIYLNYPFDEFYMEEFKAPRAEEAYRASNIDTTQKTYAVVSLLNGDAAIKDVMINEKPILQVLKEMAR